MRADGGNRRFGAGGGEVEGVDGFCAGQAGGFQGFLPGAVAPAAVGGEFGGKEMAVEPEVFGAAGEVGESGTFGGVHEGPFDVGRQDEPFAGGWFVDADGVASVGVGDGVERDGEGAVDVRFAGCGEGEGGVEGGDGPDGRGVDAGEDGGGVGAGGQDAGKAAWDEQRKAEEMVEVEVGQREEGAGAQAVEEVEHAGAGVEEDLAGAVGGFDEEGDGGPGYGVGGGDGEGAAEAAGGGFHGIISA